MEAYLFRADTALLPRSRDRGIWRLLRSHLWKINSGVRTYPGSPLYVLINGQPPRLSINTVHQRVRFAIVPQFNESSECEQLGEHVCHVDTAVDFLDVNKLVDYRLACIAEAYLHVSRLLA